MKKFTKLTERFLIILLVLCFASSSLLASAQSAKQLEKGKQFYAQEKNEEAMDAFIDVLLNGTRAEVEEANKYLNLIHNRIGGIQTPIEVGVEFQEGVAQRLQDEVNPAVVEQQLREGVQQTQEDIQQVQAGTQQSIEDALAAAGLVPGSAEEAAYRQQLAEQQAYLQEKAYTQAALAQERAAALNADAQQVQQQAYQVQTQTQAAARAAQAEAEQVYTDLTSSSAIQARQIYTNQKLESMREAAIAKLEQTKGVRLYFRNGLPDAIDIDSEILFDGSQFRSSATDVLNEIYTLLALTQGAGYTILPPGSYTDNITLSGIREAMALNSYLVHKGLSSGKISYNMGLYDEEPPAKFANLDGLSIVFDFDADLPSAMPEAASVSKSPLLSMAVVPVSNKIDPSAGEAFAIDFSVIETTNPIESWVFQIIQEASKDTYYVVRQLDGFAPVYHQILWNGRKGIIGPQMECGHYVLALTATDVQGGKRTLRRQVEVTCSDGKTSSKTSSKKTTTSVTAAAANLNYKAARLWNKPGRVMKAKVAAEVTTTEPDVVDPFAPVSSTAETVPAATPDNFDPNAQYNNNVSGQNAGGTDGMYNPYDMPYEEY